MHEVSVAQSMLDVVGAQIGGPRPLESATVTIGPLSGVDPEALRFCFTEVAESLGFGRPELHVVHDPARATCATCETTYELEDAFTICPSCGALERSVSGGETLQINSVEIAGEDQDE